MTILRFITIMVAALSMALAFSHLLQLPPRMSFDGPTWLITQRLFPLYGSIGAVIAVGAVLLAGILAYAARPGAASGWTLAGAVCLALALIVWILFVAPANARIGKWTPDSLPADWTRWRRQWEYAHAARAVLLILGLGCLVRSAQLAAG
jgi:hypothetical protein